MAHKEKKHLIYSNMGPGTNCGATDCTAKQKELICNHDIVAFSETKHKLDMDLQGKVIAIAKLSSQNNSKQGYILLSDELNSIFDIKEYYNEWYSDGKNVLSLQIHSSGRNQIMFRELRTDRDEVSIQRFLMSLYDGEEITPQKLSSYTRSLHPYVAKIYGW